MLQIKYHYQRVSFSFCLSPSIYFSILGSYSYLPTSFSYLPVHRREKVALPGNYVKHMGREDKFLTILDVHRGWTESRNAPGWNQSLSESRGKKK